MKWDADYASAASEAYINEAPIPRRPRVFCASLADWLDDEVPIEWLADLLALIHRTPNLDWLLLTKRPQNWRTRIAIACILLGQRGEAGDYEATQAFIMVDEWLSGITTPANVWIGTTVEDQERAKQRIPEVLKIPARVRFLSVEPMLGPIDLAFTCFNGADSFGTMPGIHWVIVGGESGPGARPFNTEAAWDIVLQCRKAGVAPFVKQLGAWPVTTNANAMDWPEDTIFRESFIAQGFGAASAGVKLRDKKGGDIDEFPEELRVREFPTVAA